MIKKIALFIMLCAPLFTFAQKKKSSRKVETKSTTEKIESKSASTENGAKILPYATIGSPLFPFTLVTSNDVRISNTMIPNDKPVIIVLFNPMCDHCQKAAKTINDNISKLKGATVLFACGMNLFGELNNFKHSAGIEESSDIQICAGQEEFTNQIFLGKGIPQIMIYNREHFLKKIMFETFDIEAALTAMSEN